MSDLSAQALRDLNGERSAKHRMLSTKTPLFLCQVHQRLIAVPFTFTQQIHSVYCQLLFIAHMQHSTEFITPVGSEVMKVTSASGVNE